MLARSEGHSKDLVDRAAVQDTLEAGLGYSQLEERHSRVERLIQAAIRLQKVARQHSGSAGLAAPVDRGTDTLGRAAEETAAADSAVVNMDMAVDMGCMHFCSHIPTRLQNRYKGSITAVFFDLND